MICGRADVLLELRHAHVDMVTCQYDGQGDSGQLEDPVFMALKPNSTDPAVADRLILKLPEHIVRATHDLLYDMLETHYGGWEINEGSYGEFVWNIAEDNLHLTHNMRIESVETEERNL